MTLVSEARTVVGNTSAESLCLNGDGLREPAKGLARTRKSLRALAKRRIADLHVEVCVGPWSLGWFGDADGRRLMRAPSRAPRSINKAQLACSDVRKR
ncbi:copper-containing amine oxidase [Mycolicibacterium brisbanense]|uniref:Copper-containing amine oxidase n=1 Tax=Mycolicibacterium brisbanense TaxID=146020 RepID=A0A100VWV3_9MYCO|nr:copper-containing amine oxidase [Mycolicibacterium brisbanense]